MAKAKKKAPQAKTEKKLKAPKKTNSTKLKPAKKITKKKNSTPKKNTEIKPKLAAKQVQQSKTTIKKGLNKGLLSLIFVLGLGLILTLVYLFLPTPSILSQGKTSLSTEGEIKLEFSQAMNKKSVEEKLKVSPLVTGQWIWSDSKTIQFEPTQALKIGESYRIELEEGAKNKYGKVISRSTEFYFNVDGTPEIVFVNPYVDPMAAEEGAEQALPIIDLKQPITVLFNQPMDWSTVTASDLLVTEPEVEGEVNFLDDRAFEFTPTRWPGETLVDFTVPEGLMAQNGLITAESRSWQLQTPGQRIIAVNPNPEGGIGVDQSIEVTFQLPINLEDIVLGETIQLFPSNDLTEVDPPRPEGFFGTQMSLKPEDPFTLVFNPTPTFDVGTEYELVFKSGLAGLKEDYIVSFTAVEKAQLQVAQVEKNQGLSSLPSGYAPTIKLEEKLVAPLRFQLCKLPNEEVNPLFLPGIDVVPCTPVETNLETVSQGELNLGELYSEETWDNAIYWLKITDAQEQSQLEHFFLSDTTLIVKRAGDDILVWALDRFNQEPVAQMEVRVYGPDGNEVGRGVTDGKGIYKRNQQLPQSVYVMGLKALGGENRWSISTDQWPMEVGFTSSAITTAPEVYLLTDRNQAEAGQTVKVKGLWRTPTQRGYSLPWWGEITLKLLNENGEEVFVQVLETQEKASFSGEIVLPENLRSGLYQLQGFEVEKPLSTLSTWLKVEPKGSLVSLNWSQIPEFADKAPIGVVELSDAQGLPGAANTGQWQLYEHNRFNPLHTQLIESGEFEINAQGQGRLMIEWEGENPLIPNTTYSLNVEVIDERLPATLTHTFDYNPIDYPVELSLDNLILEENSPLKGYIYPPEDGSLSSITFELYKQGEKKPTWERLVELPEPTQRFDYNDLILPDLDSGIYQLKATDGRNDLSESKLIYVSKDPMVNLSEELSLFLNHESRPVNSKSRLLINVPGASIENPITVLLGYEQAGILDYDVVVAEQVLNVIDFDVQPNMNPGVYLSALTMGQEESAQLNQLKEALDSAYKEQEEAQEALEAAETEGEIEEALTPANPPAEGVEEEAEPAVDPLQVRVDELTAQIRELQSNLSFEIGAIQAYLPVDESRKELSIDLSLEPIVNTEQEVAEEVEVESEEVVEEAVEKSHQINVQVFDEFGNPTSASLSLMVRPKVHFFISPMDYFLSLPPFNVSTHSNLLLDSQISSQQEGGQVQRFTNLVNPFKRQSYLIFEPLLLTDEGEPEVILNEAGLPDEAAMAQSLGQLSYAFDLPKDHQPWEVVVFANTQANQWGSARLDLPVTQKLIVEPVLPQPLMVGDKTQVGIKVANFSDQPIEDLLSLSSEILMIEEGNEPMVNLAPGESELFTWETQVRNVPKVEVTSTLQPNAFVQLNGQEYSFYFDSQPPTALKNASQEYFAQLNFTESESGESVTQFKQGETYHGQLTLMTPNDFDSTSPADIEELPLPLNITLWLPAGLKTGNWLAPLNDPNWPGQQQRLAEIKGISWVHHPVWHFQNYQLSGNRLQLRTEKLPAGVYQFDFEVQAVWPGEFSMPDLQWGEETVKVEGVRKVEVR